MTIIVDIMLPSIVNVKKSIKFKIKNIVPIFVRAFSFFLNHLSITVIYKYTKPNSIMDVAHLYPQLLQVFGQIYINMLIFIYALYKV